MLIDAESAEIEIINGIDFDKHRPKYMFIETMITGKENVTDALPDEYIEAISDGLNTLYVHEDFYKPSKDLNMSKRDTVLVYVGANQGNSL